MYVKFGSRFGRQQSTAPVREGDVLDVEIEAIGSKGDGIAKKDGFVLFVPNTKKGDKVKIRVARVLRNMGFANVVGSVATTKEENKELSGETQQETQHVEDTEDFGEE